MPPSLLWVTWKPCLAPSSSSTFWATLGWPSLTLMTACSLPGALVKKRIWRGRDGVVDAGCAGRVGGRGGALDGVADPVELRALAPAPQRVQRHQLAARVARPQLLGDDGVGAADAGEAGGLGQAAELDGHAARAR